MIDGSLSSCIAGFHQSCRFSQSFGPRRSCVGTGPAFAATGAGNRVDGEGGHRSRRSCALIRLMSMENPLFTEAFPWNGAPRYMIRDRDRIYGAVVTRRLRAMGIRDK